MKGIKDLKVKFNKRFRNLNGFIPPTEQELKEGWKAGDGNLAGTAQIIRPDGQWEQIPGEMQRRKVETMNCFPYNAEVLIDDFSYKRISEIKIGDYVFTHNGNRKRVTNIFKRQYKDDFISIKVRGLYQPLICTNEHPILTDRSWVKANELTEDDCIYLPLTDNFYKDSTIKEMENDDDFLWLIGFYLAEGSLGYDWKTDKDNNENLKVRGTGCGNGSITFSVSSDENEYIEKIIKIGEKYGTKFNLYLRPESKSAIVVGYNTHLRNLLDELCGRYSDKKELNPRLMIMYPDKQMQILRGWLDGDGYISKEKRKIQGVTTSKKMANQMYRIALRNKIKCCLSESYRADGKKQAYTVDIHGVEINKIYPLDIEDTDVIERKDKFINGYLLRKVSEIESVKLKNIGIVYNIEVEDDNSYIVNNIAVHNCTVYGTLNAREVLAFNVYKVLEDNSERYNGVLSGTTPSGNSPHNAAESIRNDGVIPEQMLPFDDTIENWNQYYSPKPMTQQYKDVGKKSLEFWEFAHKWVNTDPNSLMDALKYSPLGASFAAWWISGDGLYYRPEGAKDNHWAVIIGYVKNKYWIVLDSYEPYIKKVAWWSTPSFAKKYTLLKLKDDIQTFVEQYSGRIVKGNLENGVYMIQDGKKRPYVSWDAFYSWNPLPINDLVKLITIVDQNLLKQVGEGEPFKLEDSPYYQALKNLKKPFEINKY